VGMVWVLAITPAKTKQTNRMKTQNKIDKLIARREARIGRKIPSYERGALAASFNGVASPYQHALKNGRAQSKQRLDPLTRPFRDRVTWAPLALLGRLRKDAPGLLVGFEVECAGIGTAALDGVALPLLAPRIQPEHCGVEVPVLCRFDNLKPLYAVCAALSKAGGKVDRHCGGHVHLDVRDIFSGSTGRGRAKFPAALRSSVSRLSVVVEHVYRWAVPPSRVGNRFCVLGGLDWSGADRYRAVNCASLTKHRTVEVRLGAGTLNPDKWRLWAQCLVWALRHPISKGDLSLAESVRDATGAADWVMKSDLPPVEKWWLLQRIRKFHPAALPALGGDTLSTEGGDY